VNGWLWAAAVLVAALVPLVAVAARRSVADGLVALQTAGADAALASLLIAEGTRRQSFGDVAIVLAVTSFVGAIAFIHALERLR
jgi:multisubunit Na+/H+ antiporter MnhF subunit